MIGRTPSRRVPAYWNGDLPWAAISDLNGGLLISTQERISALGARESRSRLIPKGSLLFSFKLSIGKMAVAGIDVYTNEAIAALAPKCARLLDRTYLPYALSSIELTDGAGHAVKGKTLNQKSLSALAFPLPPLDEQRRIAARLSEQMAHAARARAAAEARLAHAESLPAACLREVFGPVAPLSAAADIPVDATRTGWRWRRLTDLARLATGHTPSRREPAWWGGDIRWLQLLDIRAVDGRRVMETIERTNPLGIENSSAALLPAGTVCMSRTASVGFVTIMGRDMATSQDFVNWVCGPDIDPDFLMYLLLRCRRETRELGSGATHHTIYFETVQNFSVCVPPIAEQRGIVASLSRRLASAERLAASIRAELAALEALPGALLRGAFGRGGA
ncbi:MAG: restriction endonuclease subunit S [Phycisphaeraceae bacterium]|nr:restriction endonuclease subunit S [Phycisphaeraceae bacterium]